MKMKVTCPLCGRGFQTVVAYRRHIRSYHLELQHFQPKEDGMLVVRPEVTTVKK